MTETFLSLSNFLADLRGNITALNRKYTFQIVLSLLTCGDVFLIELYHADQHRGNPSIPIHVSK